jgi:hypothetical protein
LKSIGAGQKLLAAEGTALAAGLNASDARSRVRGGRKAPMQ